LNPTAAATSNIDNCLFKSDAFAHSTRFAARSRSDFEMNEKPRQYPLQT
jgi:hypothetical protein